MSIADVRPSLDPSGLSAADIARFWSHVVKGPGERDCWLWTGAIADDGYGRFHLRGHQRASTIRPHRVAFALIAGMPVDRLGVVEHLVCDNPICVHAASDGAGHLAAGTQASNLSRVGRRATTGRPLMIRGDRPGRTALAQRSRALRDAVASGWDEDAIAEALARLHVGQTALW